VGPSAALHAAYIVACMYARKRRRARTSMWRAASFHLIHSPRAPRAAIFKVSHAQKNHPIPHCGEATLARADRLRKMRFAERVSERRTAEAPHKFIQMRPFLIDESAYALCAPSRDKTTIYGYVFLKSPPVVLMIAS
jgi:hypothetical protein